MTLAEAREKKDLKALIKVGIGKFSSIPAYVCGFDTYTAPDGTTRPIVYLSDNKNQDSITEYKTKIYTTFSELEKDLEKLKCMKTAKIAIVEA